VPGEGQVAVKGDRKRLMQVLTKLLHNAAKYPLDNGAALLLDEGTGWGASFSVYLQCHVQPELLVEGGHGAQLVSGKPLRVLVVDDNQDAANALAMLLETEGHTVAVEHDPVIALDRAGQFAPRH
jgi:hypothetical protein